jgi:hypothetical protein
MASPISPQVQLEKTYNAAADHYDHPGYRFGIALVGAQSNDCRSLQV